MAVLRKKIAADIRWNRAKLTQMLTGVYLGNNKDAVRGNKNMASFQLLEQVGSKYSLNNT